MAKSQKQTKRDWEKSLKTKESLGTTLLKTLISSDF